MNLSIRAHHVIVHFIPGFLTLVFTLLCYYNYNIDNMQDALENIKNPLLFGFVGIIAAFFIGQVVDILRNSIVHEIPKFDIEERDNELAEFLFTASEEKIGIFERYYYVYFSFDVNMCICMTINLMLIIVSIFHNGFHSCTCILYGNTLIDILLLPLLYKDARSLRKDIRYLINRNKYDRQYTK